jgi:hypothetical protein
MDDQNEILQLRKEIERLQGLLDQRTAARLPAQTDAKSLHTNFEFLSDCCRYSENLLSQEDVRKKWALTDEDWERAGSDNELVRAIEETKVQRVRSGAAKREKAQQHVVRGVDVLSKIMDDPNANPRHRVDSVKALDALADPGPQPALPAEKFIITIDLSGDSKLKNPDDVITIDATPLKTPAAIADKPEDDWKR